MSFWVWLVLAVAGIFSALLIQSSINQRAESSSMAKRVEWLAGAGNRVFILLPGILARGNEQFEMLVPTFNAHGSIDFRSYTGSGFNLNRIAKLLARDVDTYSRHGYDVTLVGASIGGLVGYSTLFRLKVANASNVSLIMVDSPYGVTTMKAFPDRAAFLTRIFKGAPLPNIIGNRILNMMRVGPKREFVDIPQGVDADLYFQLIDSKAFSGLSGHKFSTWWSQLVKMVNYRPRRLIQAYDITYVTCLGAANDVVDQPRAQALWQRSIPDLRLIEIEGAHCGFLQQSPRWVNLFADTLL